MNLSGRNFLKEIDLTGEEFLYLVDLGCSPSSTTSATGPNVSSSSVAISP